MEQSFDTFVIGSSNQFAHAAALAVARQPGRRFNPLFLYGGTGLGKTHLAASIATFASEAEPSSSVIFVSADTFTNELIAALRSDRVAAFKDRYRSADVLIVDDVHLLSGRERTQDELFHTFNAIHDRCRQVVLVSHRGPEEIPGLEERLRNRFQWGLVVDIQPPDLETRIAILHRRARDLGIELQPDAALLLAEQVNSNVRSLDGALTRLAAMASLDGRSLSPAFVRDAIADGMVGRHGPVTFEEIAQAVCDQYGVSTQMLLSRRRTTHVALPRQVAMYLCRKLLDASYPRIGNLFGRDHTTALHGVRTISTRMQSDSSLHDTVELIGRRLGRGG